MIGKLFFIGLQGLELTPEEGKFIEQNQIGGVVLFARNVKSPEQIQKLCRQMNELNLDHQPLIAIDMEGGRVARLKAPFTQWPPLQKVGLLGDPAVAYQFALAMGRELRAVGINLDFAPCLDIFSHPQNTVIGDRALGVTPSDVVPFVEPLLRGFREAGVMSCGKHFPGHGHTLLDSHFALPVENADLDRLMDFELRPFVEAIKYQVPMLMTGHLSFPHVDAKNPVTLSHFFLTELLRNKLGYQGLIITDDLDMKALASHYDIEEIPVQSFLAGADLILYCNEPESPPRALQGFARALQMGQINEGMILERIARLEKIKNATFAVASNVGDISVIGSPEHQMLAQQISVAK